MSFIKKKETSKLPKRSTEYGSINSLLKNEVKSRAAVYEL